MRPSHLILIPLTALAALAGACSSDSSTTATDPGTPTGTTTSGTGLTIIADTATNNRAVAVASSIPIRVRVLQGTTPVPNTLVTWAVTAGGGVLSSATTATDTAGGATVNWRLGDSATTNTLTASVTGSSVTITAAAIAGAASGLVRISPDSQIVAATGTVPLVARVVDRYGNAVAGATVTWVSSGGSLSVSSSVSASSGNATTNFTTSSATGPYSVTATLPGLASVTFRVVGF